ncbi:phosphoglucosamine mutase [Thermosipho atlanticus]|uniref:Phosphoglucosamine mutase n=1 Tax=Thermosipho atlanticus DSM 15807 TaxID=1123380 RepID=A0A1M5R258_9BACT|nr:phosphoglucosamine mutase [Thermosipho atlanticus]SHH19873.1 phosphoglucosamine mutase [Thermosipho atlanticus DSM 15807]
MKLFGTDGIRGVVNEFLTPDLAFRMGNAVGRIIDGRVFVAKDTRNTGDLLESALIAGLVSSGVDVYRCGIMPTPALALITKLEDSAGIMISASHNPPEYNGLKIIFKGYKLPDEIEERIENEMKNIKYVNYSEVGKVIDYQFAIEEYVNYIHKLYPNLNLNGIKILIDTANGATFNLNPMILESFGAKIKVINNKPDGFNINDNCGSTHPEHARKFLKDGDIAILHDGDGDRCIFLDESGEEVHGDKILGITACQMKNENRLSKNTVVLTILSNMGLEKYLTDNGIRVIRTRVGDRYILQEMLNNGFVLGGERSGHIIYLDRTTTGDGLITALEVLSVITKTGKSLFELASVIPDYPQVMLNLKVENKEIYKNKLVFEKIKEYKDYRIIIRPSGTEPVIRILVEGPNLEKSNEIAEEFYSLIESLL